MTDWQTIAINALAGIKAGKNFIDMLKSSDVTKVDVAVLLQFADQFATAEVAIDSLKAELTKKTNELEELRNNNSIETDYKRLNAGDGTVLVHKDEADRFKNKEYFFNPEAQCFCQYCAQDKKLYVLKRLTGNGGFSFWCENCRKQITLKEHHFSMSVYRPDAVF